MEKCYIFHSSYSSLLLTCSGMINLYTDPNEVIQYHRELMQHTKKDYFSVCQRNIFGSLIYQRILSVYGITIIRFISEYMTHTLDYVVIKMYLVI